jgi:hypothetical protein
MQIKSTKIIILLKIKKKKKERKKEREKELEIQLLYSLFHNSVLFERLIISSDF